jgi:hypothetical protein
MARLRVVGVRLFQARASSDPTVSYRPDLVGREFHLVGTNQLWTSDMANGSLEAGYERKDAKTRYLLIRDDTVVDCVG